MFPWEHTFQRVFFQVSLHISPKCPFFLRITRCIRCFSQWTLQVREKKIYLCNFRGSQRKIQGTSSNSLLAFFSPVKHTTFPKSPLHHSISPFLHLAAQNQMLFVRSLYIQSLKSSNGDTCSACLFSLVPLLSLPDGQSHPQPRPISLAKVNFNFFALRPVSIVDLLFFF